MKIYHQVQPTCEQKENSETGSFNLSQIPQKNDVMIGENVFNPTQQRLLILVKPRLQKNPNNSLVVLATIHLLLDKTHPLRLFVHTPPSIKNTNKKRLK